jgi:hypothetical protein
MLTFQVWQSAHTKPRLRIDVIETIFENQLDVSIREVCAQTLCHRHIGSSCPHLLFSLLLSLLFHLLLPQSFDPSINPSPPISWLSPFIVNMSITDPEARPGFKWDIHHNNLDARVIVVSSDNVGFRVDGWYFSQRR